MMMGNNRSAFLTIIIRETPGLCIPTHHRQLWDDDTSEESNLVNTKVVDSPIRDSQNENSWLGLVMPKQIPDICAILECNQVQLFSHAYKKVGTAESPFWPGDGGRKFVVSASEPVSFSVRLYARHPVFKPGEGGRARDICIGVARCCLELGKCHRDGQDKDLDGRESSTGVARQREQDMIACTKWLDIENGTGRIRVTVKCSENDLQQLRVEDFEVKRTYGSRKSRMMQVRKRDTGQLYALKDISKTRLYNVSQAKSDIADVIKKLKSRAFSMVNNPFIVPIKFAFQSSESLFLVSPFIRGGRVMERLQEEKCPDIQNIKHYAAEILCALDCLQDSNIFCGNLMGHNILLDLSGHILICDFELALDQLCMDTKRDFWGDCAPEIRFDLASERRHTPTAASDWWTVGVIITEMLSTSGPLGHGEIVTAIHSITESQSIVFPAAVPPSGQDLCIKLLNHNPEQRLGAGAEGVAEIKNHPFFDGIDWNMVFKREYEPCFKPDDKTHRGDTTCCDFDRETKLISAEDTPLYSKEEEEAMIEVVRSWPTYVKTESEVTDDSNGTLLPQRGESFGD